MNDGWISVMDRLPKYHKRVAIRYRDKVKHKTFETIGYYNIHKHCWCNDYSRPFHSEVIAWKSIE